MRGWQGSGDQGRGDGLDAIRLAGVFLIGFWVECKLMIPHMMGAMEETYVVCNKGNEMRVDVLVCVAL